MSVPLNDLVKMLDDELQPWHFKDYCPNGVQIEGCSQVSKVVTGVTACLDLIEKAIELEADALLVHHGYFWRGEAAHITGMKQRRIKKLLENNISLLAYHLPLDAHSSLGNNAQLARLMGWQVIGGLEPDAKYPVGNLGKTAKPATLDELGQNIEAQLKRPPLLISGGSQPIHTIAWCTGAAQSMIDKALEAGADAFVSGEISESTVHFARENGIHYISAGHHATERYGVQALADWLAQKAGIKHEFVDIDSPV